MAGKQPAFFCYPGTKLNQNNWNLWKGDIQQFLSRNGLWEMTTGESIRPTRPDPPEAILTIDQRLRYETSIERFDEWERKSWLAYSWIKASCSGTDAARFEGCGSGQAAMMVLQEWYEPTPQQIAKAKGAVFFDNSGSYLGKSMVAAGCAKWHVLPLYCLLRLCRSYGDHKRLEDRRLKQEAEILSARCKENGYALPPWMVCYFFESSATREFR